VDIQLTQGRDGTDHMPASNAFIASEIDTLAVLGPTLEGSTERQQKASHRFRDAKAGMTTSCMVVGG
jgi:hypothetical protein